ncbi:hypothetical protein [Aliiroseovarius crassostreae]|uniref:hypothetical protein n=1 Tax=Aliiroseovarius crassostreae TaxID=154981 RepID=UPI003C7B13DB
MAPPAAACTLSKEELTLSLIGDWQVTNSYGTLTFAGKTMPLPAGNAARAQIVPTETGLAVVGDMAPGTHELTFIEDARFTLDAPSQTILDAGEHLFGEKPQIVTHEEAALIAGCAEGQMLPQVYTSGQFQDPEGMVDFELFLFVLNERSMYGILSGELHAMGGQAKRATHWSR